MTYNSNLWRNFRSSSGLVAETKKGNVTEAISDLYPMTIPSPSQIGLNTLSSFYEQNRFNMFKSDKSYNLALSRAENDATIMKFLRLKSELRNPPLDFDGSILPPKNFKSYPPIPLNKRINSSKSEDYYYRKLKSSKSSGQSNLNLNSQVDFSSDMTFKNSIGVQATKKLVHRDNHPNFDKVLVEKQIKERQRRTAS